MQEKNLRKDFDIGQHGLKGTLWILVPITPIACIIGLIAPEIFGLFIWYTVLILYFIIGYFFLLSILKIIETGNKGIKEMANAIRTKMASLKS